MTFAELLLALSVLAVVFFLLRPLQRYLEGLLLKLWGVQRERIVDATIVKEKIKSKAED